MTTSSRHRPRHRRRPSTPAAAQPAATAAAPSPHRHNEHHRLVEGGPTGIVIDGEITPVYGNETTSTVRMFPEPAAATCTDKDAWTPHRLRHLDERDFEHAN